MAYGTANIDTITSSGNLSITGNVTTSGTVTLTSQTLSSATAGKMEYDGKIPYFTPLGTQRGIIPGMQYYRLNSDLTGANSTGAQNWFGVGVTLSSNTVYTFDAYIISSKTAGTTSHTIATGFGGTFTNNNILYTLFRTGTTVAFNDTGGAAVLQNTLQTASSTVITGARTNAAFYDIFWMRGTVSVNAGGTFIPQYTLSAAPGGAYTTAAGSYFLIYPIGASGSNTSVGTWA